MDEAMEERGQRGGCVQGNRRMSRGRPHRREGCRREQREGENVAISERRKERFIVQHQKLFWST